MTDDLIDALQRAQDATIAGHVEAARRRFDEAPARRRWPWFAAMIPVAAVVAVVAMWPGGSDPQPLTFEVGARPGTLLEPLEAPHDAELPLRFSDRTTVFLAAHSRGTVDEVTPRGARMRVSRGNVAVSVPPHQNEEWTFDVGPFEVAVTGTRFDVGWDDTHRVFELVMHDGVVKVTGPGLDGQRIVRAGETLRVPLDTPVAETPPIDAPPDTPIVVPEVPAPVEPVHVTPRPVVIDAAVPEPPPAPSWQQLAAGGDFKGAIAAVRDHFDDVLATASAPELTTLGDTARYAGDATRAQQAYLAVRKRFATESATATFALARLAFQAPDDAMAVKWLDTYLRENPDGAFSREALGRLLEVRVRTHDEPNARDIASRYLRLYPSGPHAKLARSVLP
jgi:hypothetical protein